MVSHSRTPPSGLRDGGACKWPGAWPATVACGRFPDNSGDIEDLHRFIGTAHLNGDTRCRVKRQAGFDPCQDGQELAHAHGLLALGERNVLNLQNGFRPVVRVAAAVQGRKLSGLDFRDMIAGLNCPAGIV